MGTGSLLALLFQWAKLPAALPATDTRAVALWVCDRDGGRITGLDGDGFLLQERPVHQALEVAPAGGQGLWILGAVGPGGKRGRALSRMDPEGPPTCRLQFPGAFQLRPGPAGSARLLVRVGLELSWVQVNSGGQPERVVPAGDALGWEALPWGLALVGPDWIRCQSWGLSGRDRTSLRELRLPVGERVLAHTSLEGRLWILLEGQETRRVLELDEQLQCVHPIDLPDWPLDRESGWFLAPAPGEQLWVIGRSGHVLRLGLQNGKQWRTRLMSPIQDVRVLDGELWCASAGGLQRLDGNTHSLPGQAGFEFLTRVSLDH